jgi:tetratricopeptide (TPR) repeat protein
MERISSPIIATLKIILPESSWAWVIPAVQEDELVWETLNSYPDLFKEEDLQKIIHTPDDCSPAALALRLLEYPVPPVNLRSLPLIPIDAQFVERIKKGNLQAVQTLDVAGLQALSLRQLRSESGSWDDWSHDLWSASPTSLSCLYGIVPDQLDLLRAIVPPLANSENLNTVHIKAYKAIIHIVLSNPLTVEAQTEILNILLEELGYAQRFQLIEHLYKIRPGIASRLISHLAKGVPNIEQKEPESILDYLSLLEKLYTVQKSQRITGQGSQEVSALIKSIKISRQLQSKFSTRVALAAMGLKDNKTALACWEQAALLEPDSPLVLCAYLFFLIDQGRIEEVKAMLNEQRIKATQPAALVSLVEQIIKQDDPANTSYPCPSPSQLKQVAKEAIDSLEEFIHPQDEADIYDIYLQAVLAFQLVQKLAQHKSFPEAIRALTLLNRILPQNLLTLVFLANTQQFIGHYRDAVDIMHLVVALEPDNLDLRRILATCMEANHDWENALSEWNSILNKQKTPPDSDAYAQIACSIHSDQIDQAIQACEKLLKKNSKDGLAYAFLGKTSISKGNMQEARSYLDQAVQLAPHHPFTWLCLAGFFKDSDHPVERQETLLAGIQTISGRPELDLALGEYYLEQGSLTQSLTEFKRAFEAADNLCNLFIPFSLSEFISHPADKTFIPPENFIFRQNLDWLSDNPSGCQLKTQISAKYGKTLLALGHDLEATQVLEQAYQEISNNPDLSAAYAETLMKQQKYIQAIEPLKSVVESGVNRAEPYLAYAKCLMELEQVASNKEWYNDNKKSPGFQSEPNNEDTSEKIITLLEKAIEIDPNNTEAKIYLGEARIHQGEFENALGLFNEILEAPLLHTGKWKDRIALDVGKVTLKLGRGDLALAALKDANQKNPQIQQHLAEAYQVMDLVEDAFKSAQSALQLAPDNLDNILWFVKFSQELKDHHNTVLPHAMTEVSAVLRHAIDLAPQRSDLWIAKGQMAMKLDDVDEALAAFRNLVPGNPLTPLTGSTPAELYCAAKSLLELDDPSSAVTCLEYALQNNSADAEEKPTQPYPGQPSLLQLLSLLAEARLHHGQADKAIQALDQALAIAPDEISLYLTKTNLMLALGSQNSGVNSDQNLFNEIIACLDGALKLAPDNPNILLTISLIERYAGDVPTALMHAEQLQAAQAGTSTADIKILPESGYTISPYACQVLTHDLTKACLRQMQTSPDNNNDDWPTPTDLNTWLENESGTVTFFYPGPLDYFYQQVEACLDNDDVQNAAQHLIDLEGRVNSEPRTQSLLARVNYRQGETDAAINLMKSALACAQERYGNLPTTYLPHTLQELSECFAAASTYRLIATAACELSLWDDMLVATGQVISFTSKEPLPYLENTSALVVTREFQQLCRDMQVNRHAPSTTDPDEDQVKVHEALTQVENLISTWGTQDRETAQYHIQKWNARSRAIFDPNPENAQLLAELPASSDDVSAQMACLRGLNRLPEASRPAQIFPQDPAVLIQLALTYETGEAKKALLAAQSAAEILNQPKVIPGKDISSLFSVRSQLEPIIFALQARLTIAAGDRSGDIQKAVSSIEKALSLWPDEAGWQALAAQIYQMEDASSNLPDITQAIVHMDQAMKLEPNHWEYSFDLGRLSLKANNIPQAIEILRTAATNAPQESRIWNLLAETYLNIGNVNEARLCLDNSLSLNPNDTHLMVLRGEIALQENDFQGAEKFARSVLEKYPDEPIATLLLARSLSKTGKVADAQALLEKKFPTNSQTLPLFLERARLISQQEGPQAALENLNKVAKQFPEQPAVLAALAGFHEAAGDPQSALQVAQQALRAGHNLPEDHNFIEHAKLHCLLGRLMHKEGQLDQAVQHLNEAIRLVPGYNEPYLELGQTHLDRRQYQEAIQVYQQAIQADPQSANIFYHAGLAYKQCKDYLNAEKMFRQAAKLSPDDLTIQRQLGAVVALNLVHNRKL